MRLTGTKILSYGVSLLTVAVALLLTLLFQAVLAPTVFLLFLAAVMVSAWYGGLKPALLTTFVSVAVISVFFSGPPLGLTLSWANALRLTTFVAVAVLISSLSESRKRSNESLREANHALQALIQASPLAIVVLDVDAKVKLWSPAAEDIFGWADHEVLNRPLPIISLDKEDAFHATLDAAWRGNVLTGFETCRERKDGSSVHISVSAAPSHNHKGDIGAIMVVVADVTERKRSETALRESEMKFRSVVQSATDGIILADSDGKIIQWNHGAQQIFGYTEEEVLGKPLTMLMPEHYREAHQRGLDRVRGGGEPHIMGKTIEVQGLKRSGAVFPIGLSVASWEIGKTSFYSGIIRDISDQKHKEDDLRKLTEALTRSDELKSALLASVSHDLRTPLTSIRTAIENLLHSDLRWNHSQQQEFHLIISEEASRLTRLVEDLLDMARIEAGELRPSMQLGVVAEICGNVLERCEGELREHRVLVDCPEDLPLVKVDSPLIAEALTHLIENAAKYSPAGSEISVSALIEGDELLISVKDQGPGIAKDEFDRVFDKFYRSTHLPDHNNIGTGMGLPIARGIIKAHGGRIWVESEPGQGSVFKFALHVGDTDTPEVFTKSQVV